MTSRVGVPPLTGLFHLFLSTLKVNNHILNVAPMTFAPAGVTPLSAEFWLLICYMCMLSHCSLSTLPIGVTSILCSMIVALLGHLQYFVNEPDKFNLQ